MLKWARLRMPPLPKEGDPSKPKKQMSLDGMDINARQQWVDLMLDKARANLLRAEMGLEESFQHCEDDDNDVERKNLPNAPSSRNQIQSQTNEEEEEDAWQ